MLIDDIFDVHGMQCIEPVFAEITDDYYTEALLSVPAEEARLLLDENEYPIALALRMVTSLISEVWGSLDNASCVDCCCGSGVIAEAIRECGGQPCGYDNDPTLIALGLQSRRLHPHQVMHIDALRATDYIAPATYGVGCMLGDITAFNAGMWADIVFELLALSEQTLITTATEPEIRRVEEWAVAEGRTCEIRENERDPIYDRWVCIASV
jgi:hypothetical protein